MSMKKTFLNETTDSKFSRIFLNHRGTLFGLIWLKIQILGYIISEWFFLAPITLYLITYYLNLNLSLFEKHFLHGEIRLGWISNKKKILKKSYFWKSVFDILVCWGLLLLCWGELQCCHMWPTTMRLCLRWFQ